MLQSPVRVQSKSWELYRGVGADHTRWHEPVPCTSSRACTWCRSNPAAPQHPNLMPQSQGTPSPHPSRNLCIRMQTALQAMPAPGSKA